MAIAAPSIPLAVVQFRTRIEYPIDRSNKTFLNMYWRELGVAWNHTDGYKSWGSPFRDCGPMTGRWLWPFSVTVQVRGIKVVATSFIAADTDPCIDALDVIFGKKHNCDRETTFCFGDGEQTISSIGSYTCVCRFGYFIPNQTNQYFSGETVESGNGNFSCQPCPGVCPIIFEDNSESVFLSMEKLFKASIGAILGACILCCLVLAAIVFRQRKSKVINFNIKNKNKKLIKILIKNFRQ